MEHQNGFIFFPRYSEVALTIQHAKALDPPRPEPLPGMSEIETISNGSLI